MAREDHSRGLLAGYVLLAILLVCQLGLGVAGAPRSLRGATDFRAFYAAGKIVSSGQGHSLYSYSLQAETERRWIGPNDRTLPFLYPAFAALLFAPFSFLKYRVAFLAFDCLNLVLLLFFSRWASRQLGLSGKDRWLLLAAFVCCVPVLMALLQGQMSFVLLCVYAAAYSLSEQKKDLTAGVVLSFALVKFQLGIPVVLLLLCWKRWRMVGGVVLGACILFALSLLVSGPAGLLAYLHGTTTMAHVTAASPLAAKATYGMFPSDMPNLHGLCFVLFRGGTLALAVSIALSLAVMVIAALRATTVPAALCAAMLVSYHMQAYDMTLLLLPIVVAAAYELKRWSSSPGVAFRVWARGMARNRALLCLAGVLLVVPVGTALVFFGLSWTLVLAVMAVMLCLCNQEQTA